MNDEQRKESQTYLQNIHKKIPSYLSRIKRTGNSIIPSPLYEDLTGCEKHLRRLADDFGLLNPNQKTIYDAMAMI